MPRSITLHFFYFSYGIGLIFETTARYDIMHGERKGEQNVCLSSRLTIGGGGWGCNKLVPVLGGNGTKKGPAGDIFD